MEKVLFCGWNGFGQLANDAIFFDKPTVIPFCGPTSCISCSWSLLSIVSGNHIVLMGFLKGKKYAKKYFALPDNLKVLQVSTSTNQTLICSVDGTCWRHVADTDTLHQLLNFVTTESEIDRDVGNDKIIKVCCSDYINLALSESGRVFSIPTSIWSPGIRVIDVACGNEHCILLTDSGAVYSWGRGLRGQLGHGTLDPEESPRLIDAFQDLALTTISCGAWHSAVVSHTGDLYTWGWDSAGQLGRASGQSNSLLLDTENKKRRLGEVLEPSVNVLEDSTEGPVQSLPVPVDTLCDVKTVSCGARHTVVLLMDGSIWGCGWNAYGQLGVSPEECCQSASLRKIVLPFEYSNVSRVVCGGWSTCFVLDGVSEV